MDKEFELICRMREFAIRCYKMLEYSDRTDEDDIGFDLTLILKDIDDMNKAKKHNIPLKPLSSYSAGEFYDQYGEMFYSLPEVFQRFYIENDRRENGPDQYNSSSSFDSDIEDYFLPNFGLVFPSLINGKKSAQPTKQKNKKPAKKPSPQTSSQKLILEYPDNIAPLNLSPIHDTSSAGSSQNLKIEYNQAKITVTNHENPKPAILNKHVVAKVNIPLQYLKFQEHKANQKVASAGIEKVANKQALKRKQPDGSETAVQKQTLQHVLPKESKMYATNTFVQEELKFKRMVVPHALFGHAYMCDICWKICKTWSGLRIHYKTHSRVKAPKRVKKNSVQASAVCSNLALRCRNCGIMFKTHAEANAHSRNPNACQFAPRKSV